MVVGTHRPPSSSFLPYRILNINHKKELLRGLWVLRVLGLLGSATMSPTIPKPYLDPKRPTFLGAPFEDFLIEVLKEVGLRLNKHLFRPGVLQP